MQACLEVWKRCFDYNGKTTKADYGKAVRTDLFLVLPVSFVVLALITVLSLNSPMEPQKLRILGSLLLGLWRVPAIAWFISATVRRLRDVAMHPKRDTGCWFRFLVR